jgi:predicted DNA-binding protein
MPTSIRLDPSTDRTLDVLAKRYSISKSALVRRAIEDLLAREDLSPYERVSDLIGSVSGGPEDLSERTGDKLRALLAERSR